MGDPSHPGETLRQYLDLTEMSPAELASQIKVPVHRINAILNGRISVNGDTALRLGRFFGTSREFWLNLQKFHDLELEYEKHQRRIGSVAGKKIRK